MTLPSDQALWLVLDMALFRDEPVHEVAQRLNICAEGPASHDLLARSGGSEVRKRLGAYPVEWLFRQTGNQWGCERYDGDTWQGLQVLAVDGALPRTADTRVPVGYAGTKKEPFGSFFNDLQTSMDICKS